MKRVTRVGIALGFAAATAVLSVAPAQADTAAPGSTTTVCFGTPTPAGYVDLGWMQPGCWMGFPAGVRVIEKVDGFSVGTQVTACADSPIPAGWTIVKSYLDNSGALACSTVNGVNTITLQRTS
jgi:hypothetical protein